MSVVANVISVNPASKVVVVEVTDEQGGKLLKSPFFVKKLATGGKTLAEKQDIAAKNKKAIQDELNANGLKNYAKRQSLYGGLVFRFPSDMGVI